MKKLLIPAIAAFALVGCGSDDDSSDTETVTSDTVSLETCQDVSLDELRIFSAAQTTLNTELTFSQALAVYKFPVVAGQDITAELTVPDDKDYNMALFDDEGTKLGCSDTAGFGEDETIEYTVEGIEMLYVKVWTAASPTSSEFFLTLSTPVEAELTEEEPNDSLETAQVISESFSTIEGTVNDGNDDEYDYFQYTVAEDDIVTVSATVDGDNIAGLISTGLFDQANQQIYVDENNENTDSSGDDLFHSFNEGEGFSVQFTYVVPASQTKIYARMIALGGSASYSITVQIETP